MLSWGPFLETLRAIFGCHNSLCISRTEKMYVVKFHSHLYICYLENMLKDQLSKTSGWQLHKWFCGPAISSGISINEPLLTDVSIGFARDRSTQRECFRKANEFTEHQQLACLLCIWSGISNVHKTKKNKASITIPNQQGLIRITMVLFSSAILVRYMKVYPSNSK